MRAYAGIFIIISLLLIGTVGAAGIPATVTVSTDKPWIRANNVDQSTITVTVLNASNMAVQGATVNLAVNNTIYGTFGSLSTTTVTTDSSGMASTAFNVKTKSGAAEINATIPAQVLSDSIIQNIDHDVLIPKYTPTTETVGNLTTFTLSLKDIWGNPIDDRRSDDTVSLSVTCPLPNDCSFVGNTHFYSSQPLNGNLSIPLQLGSKTGQTIITMSPVQDLSQQVFMIKIIPSNPLVLTADISPAAVPPSTIPTVNIGTGFFTFSFKLSDKLGNPSANESILINASGEEQLAKTNAVGQTPRYTYGPQGSAGTFIITATVVSNPSINTSFSLAFKSAEPTMSLFVIPLDMSSLDYVPPTQADVVVSVRDDLGNPIQGQTIILTLNYTWGANWTAAPYLGPHLTTYSGTTDATGKVKTTFIPGSFNVSGAPEQASAKLTANWVQDPFNSPKNVTITWSNSPYINVYPVVSSDIVKVGDYIDVTLKVAVNGKANTGPLTIVLDQDASGNMGRAPTGAPLTMEEYASAASKTFISKLNEAKTRIGMETFGDKTEGPPTVGRLDIPSSFSAMNASLDQLASISAGSPGLTGGATDYLASIIRSEDKIRVATASGTGHENDVKILVFLSDGGSIIQGDRTPPYSGEFKTLVDKAIGDGSDAQKIRIMTICYTNNNLNPSGAEQLRDLSAATGGTAFIATNAGELAAKFQELIVIISELCGSNTHMAVSFDNIKINKTYTATNGSEVYDYIPVAIPAGLAVNVTSAPSATINSSARTSIIWPNNTQSIINQSNQFPVLQFDVGKVGLGKNWTTTFRLKAKKIGCYNLFGPGSAIDFGVGTFPLTLPDIPICVNTTVNSTGVLQGTLNVTEFQTSSSGPFTEFVPLQWKTYYNSTISTNQATEYVYYKRNGGPWVQFNIKSAPASPTPYSSQSTSLDVRNLPWGIYSFWVHSTAVDANEDNDYINGIQVGLINKSYIKLQ